MSFHPVAMVALASGLFLAAALCAASLDGTAGSISLFLALVAGGAMVAAMNWYMKTEFPALPDDEEVRKGKKKTPDE